jgi:UDP-GlcNAc:undecaprenyl-phosphate GlcNAc-1-phosphate transferase
MPSTVILLGVCSLGLSLLLTPLLREIALRRAWVDQPDHNRKMHTVPIPRLGGIAIVLAYTGSFAILLSADLHGSLVVQQSLPLVWRLLPAAGLIFVIGLLDDLVGLKPWQKLLGEILAAGLVCFNGIHIESLGGYTVEGFLGVPLTIVWLVACCNAFNLIDGMDGLASGLGFLASITILIAGILHGDAWLVIATAPLAGALLGFLFFNFSPASIFLGDCGSLTVGFMLACYGVIWCQKSATILGITAPLMALSIPLIDTVLSIARRFLRRQPIFTADRGHIHHRLLDRGLTPRRVALLLYAVSGLAACLSLLQSWTRNGAGSIVIILFCIVVWIGIRYLKYQEFGVALRLLRQARIRSMVSSHISLSRCEELLFAAVNEQECWCAIRKIGQEFGFSHVELQLGDLSHQEEMHETENQHWMLHIPLANSGYVRFMCQFESSKSPTIVVELADIVHRTLGVKAVEFSLRPQIVPKKVIAPTIVHILEKEPTDVVSISPQL